MGDWSLLWNRHVPFSVYKRLWPDFFFSHPCSFFSELKVTNVTSEGLLDFWVCPPTNPHNLHHPFQKKTKFWWADVHIIFVDILSASVVSVKKTNFPDCQESWHQISATDTRMELKHDFLIYHNHKMYMKGCRIELIFLTGRYFYFALLGFL